jgi:uncharacterized protein YndB with AHSA1/START domain
VEIPSLQPSPPRIDTASILVSAHANQIYGAFADPTALAMWLPPSDMTGRVLEYDFQEGGRYRIELSYNSDVSARAAKTTERTDVSTGRFLEIEPGKRIVQSVEFESGSAAFAGEMILTWSFSELATGTRVTVTAENVPAGITRTDHEAGLRSSLENLSRFISS